MSISNIETFEHDIAEEIRQKEATIGDIASFGGEIGNTPAKPASTSAFYIALGIIIFAAIVGVLIVVGFKYYGNASVPAANVTKSAVMQRGVPIDSVSETLRAALDPSIKMVQKSEYGYTVELKSYSDVFAYMLKNEDDYVDELATAVGTSRDIFATGTPPFSFADVTINNQNMRVGTSGANTVVYAFVNAKYLLISRTTDGILALRSAILR